MREIEAVRQEAALLQDQMRLVKQDIQKVNTYPPPTVCVFVLQAVLTPNLFNILL